MSKLVRKGGLGAAFAVALGGVASAADIYVPPASPMTPITAPMPFSWAGHYVGLQGGGIWGGGADGGVAGVFGGWNWQSGSLVYGLDVNANWAFSEGFIGNIRGRLGHAFADRWLVYGTAGVAGTSFDSDFDVGYTVGGGVEYAAWDHANLRLDYSFTDTGDNNDAHALMLGVVFKNSLFGY
jgi:outer membrane immunogenic protein